MSTKRTEAGGGFFFVAGEILRPDGKRQGQDDLPPLPGGVAFFFERADFFDARRFHFGGVGRVKVLPAARILPDEAFAQPGEVLLRRGAVRQAHQQAVRAFFDDFAAVFERGSEEGLVGGGEVVGEDGDVVLAVVGRRAAPDGGELFARLVGGFVAQAGEPVLACGKRQQLPVFVGIRAAPGASGVRSLREGLGEFHKRSEANPTVIEP